MRRVLVCEKLTSSLESKAEALGIPEISVGVPPIMSGAIKGTTLPCVVVESATNPYSFLYVRPLSQVSKEELAGLSDLAPTQEDTVFNLQAFMEQARPKLVLVDQHEVKINNIMSELAKLRIV